MVNETSGNLIPFENILEALHVQPVHYKTNQTCSKSCNQKMICQRIKDVNGLIDQMMIKLSQKFSIFEGSTPIVVGSLKEGTKIGKIDETDITLILSERLKIHLEFDRKQQRIMVRKYHYKELGEDVKETNLQLPAPVSSLLGEE